MFLSSSSAPAPVVPSATTSSASRGTPPAKHSNGNFKSGPYDLKWEDGGNHTKFTFSIRQSSRRKRNIVSAPLTGLSNFYGAFAFSSDRSMVDIIKIIFLDVSRIYKIIKLGR